MIRSLLIAVVVLAGAVVGSIGAHQAIVFNEHRAAAAVVRATESRKTREINVPRIKDGVVRGYAVLILSYTVDTAALKTAEMAPEPILVDEAFRYVYGDDTIDFDHLDRLDFATMTKALTRAVNARVKAEALVDVGVQEFTYALISDTHARP
jgi:hypothetical protein